ncbi:MAG: hypothetical protein ABSC56_11285 [Solirubrobacteraceae bacterium]
MPVGIAKSGGLTERATATAGVALQPRSRTTMAHPRQSEGAADERPALPA